MAIFQCDLRRKNYGAFWNNLFNFFDLAKHIKKITSSFGVDYFLLLPLLTTGFVKELKFLVTPNKTADQMLGRYLWFIHSNLRITNKWVYK